MGMYLAEALAERTEVQARIHEVQNRLRQSARIQEGDELIEDPAALLAELDGLFRRQEELIRLINATNAATSFGDDGDTLADALVRRDNILQRRRFYAELADAASARQDRYSRSEVKFVAALDIRELRARADELSKLFRELDTRIQQKNWLTEVLDRE